MEDVLDPVSSTGQALNTHRTASLYETFPAVVKKCRLQEATLVMQRTKGLIDQDMLEMLIAPISNLRREHEREVELLVEQKKLNEQFDQLEGIIRSYFARYADAVASLDSEGMKELMRLLDVRLVASPGRVMVTGVLDPSLFTTGQTLACQQPLYINNSFPGNILSFNDGPESVTDPGESMVEFHPGNVTFMVAARGNERFGEFYISGAANRLGKSGTFHSGDLLHESTSATRDSKPSEPLVKVLSSLPRGLAGKPLAGFRATPSRRIPVLCGMIVYVIRFNNQLLHR